MQSCHGKLIVSKWVKKLPVKDRIRNFVAGFKTDGHLFLY